MNGCHEGAHELKLGEACEACVQLDRTRRGRVVLYFLLGVVMLQLMAYTTAVVGNRAQPRGTFQALRSAEPISVHGRPGWVRALELLHSSPRSYVVVDVKNGLGNRLRALSSALAVAEALKRPAMVIWVPDLHCNCSFTRLFSPPWRFVLLEEEIPQRNLSSASFQKFNYMRPEPGAVKDAWVEPDPTRHLYFKSAFLMNNPHGGWVHAQRQLQRLVPVPEVMGRVVATNSTVGLHIRNVFDAPRDAKTNTSVLGVEAVRVAEKEYGVRGTRRLLEWRKASHWTNFVPRMGSLMREHLREHTLQDLPAHEVPPLHFYLAADSEEAYAGLISRFPTWLLYTRRQCATERCDFRDCQGMLYSLIDMINLGRTRLILGSGWSSYSEVAAYWGGSGGRPVQMLMAGRDFGQIVDRKGKPQGEASCCSCCSTPLSTHQGQGGDRKAAPQAEDSCCSCCSAPLPTNHGTDIDLPLHGFEWTNSRTAAIVRKNWSKPF